MTDRSVSAQTMNLPLCCGWCGKAYYDRVPDKGIFTCKACGKQTSAHVASEHRDEQYAQMDRFLGWGLTPIPPSSR